MTSALSTELWSFLGALAGGAIAGLASSTGRWRKVDARLQELATKAAEAAAQRHAETCQLRAVATAHLAEDGAIQLTPSGRYPLNPPR